MNTKTVENLQYITIILLVLGQCTVGSVFYLGQGIYLVANLISIFRSFVLNRPMADKTKDCICFAISLGLILIKAFVIKS